MLRHWRLLGSFAKYSLLGEMAFRANYLVKVIVELLWLGMMVFFYETIFANTGDVAGWTKHQYFFFLGCFYALEGSMEALFLGNFGEFAELVRKGDLDLVLLQPVDEQFVVSFRHFEWSTVPNIAFGFVMMAVSGWKMDLHPSAGQVLAFIVGGLCALGMAYSFLLMLSSTSVWLVRNQSLYELWWLFTSLMRYPKEIFNSTWWSVRIGQLFTFVIPVLLAINVPARSMVDAVDPLLTPYTAAVTVGLLVLSRWVFKRALRSYRSASS